MCPGWQKQAGNRRQGILWEQQPEAVDTHLTPVPVPAGWEALGKAGAWGIAVHSPGLGWASWGLTGLFPAPGTAAAARVPKAELQHAPGFWDVCHGDGMVPSVSAFTTFTFQRSRGHRDKIWAGSF